MNSNNRITNTNDTHQDILFKFKWDNFRSIKDMDWMKIKPLTIFIGPNNSGKTSLFDPLLVLKQTIESRDFSLPLKTKGKYVNVGDYENFIYNHKISKKLELEIFYHFHENEETIKKLGEYPPGGINLVFKKGAKDNNISLVSFEIKDVFNRIMLKREILPNGKYNFDYFISKESEIKKLKKRVNDAISNDMPKHFLFDSYNIILSCFPELEKVEEKEIKSVLEDIVTPNKPLLMLTSILEHNAQELKSFLNHIDYIGPLRQKAKRYYESIGEIPYSVGPLGQFTPDILFQLGKTKLNLINRWLNKFDIKGEIDCKEHAPGVFSIFIKDKKGKRKINIADIGFGISQLLPLLTQGIYMEKGRTFIIEQPEIHLNPKLQNRLADFLVEIVNTGKNIILETHSEHLLLRLRSLIANPKNKITNSDVNLYFVTKEKNITRIKQIPINKDGHIDEDEWPKDFFEESLHESFNLASIQVWRKKNETRTN